MLLMNMLTVNMLHVKLIHLKQFSTLGNDDNFLLKTKKDDKVAVPDAKQDCGLKTAASQSLMDAFPLINLRAEALTAEWVAYTALPQAPDFCIVAAKTLGAKKDAAQAHSQVFLGPRLKVKKERASQNG